MDSPRVVTCRYHVTHSLHHSLTHLLIYLSGASVVDKGEINTSAYDAALWIVATGLMLDVDQMPKKAIHPVYSLTHILTHSFTYPHTDSLIHAYTHSLMLVGYVYVSLVLSERLL